MKVVLIVLAAISLNTFAMSKADRVNKVIELTKVEETTRRSIDAIVKQMVQNNKNVNPDKLRGVMKDVLNIDEMIKFQKDFYANNFTESELDDVITFQQSKGGIKMQDKAPQLSIGVMNYMKKQLSKNAEKIRSLRAVKKK